MLNNALTHKLSQVCYITKGQVTAATGEAKRLLERAPIGETIHDFRNSFDQIVQPNEHTEWREVDADMAYTVMAQLQMPDGGTVSALFKASTMATGRHASYLAFYGEQGTLHLSGPFAPNRIEHFDNVMGTWQELTVPAQIINALPQVENHVQRDWNQLCREFVADIRGEGGTIYPTFHDGLVHNQVIDAARRGEWVAIPMPVHA
jgi:hypothetical protein